MKQPQLTEVGVIKRTHGVNGEVQVIWNNDFKPDNAELESVFLQIEGIPIPFFIKKLRNKGINDSLVLFDEVESIEQANEIMGLSIYAEIIRKEEPDEIFLDDLVGYTIISSNGVQVGTIEELQDYAGNLVFQIVNTAGHETLIPATSDFILELDEEEKILIMELPEGLIDI
ncbi:MAG: ribosome maturation factor RimM [Perlabentimonas sp.]